MTLIYGDGKPRSRRRLLLVPPKVNKIRRSYADDVVA